MRRRTPVIWRTLGRGLLIVVAVGALLALLMTGVLVGAAMAINSHLPPVDALYAPASEATRIYAADGELVASLYQENRDSVPLSRVPTTLQRAVVDTEDADFYHNRGISVRGILRAGFRNLVEGGYAEGGSTITQQLARNLFLTPQKSLTRKIAEMLLAVQIERRLTKDEILARYLNQVYFGEGAYGVETAAGVYFGKRVTELTLPQSAMLAGLIRAPSAYSPYEHSARAKARMAEVLQRMVDVGDLTPAEMNAALGAPLDLAAKGNGGLIGIRAPYFVSYILPGLLQRYGEDVLYKGGLRIYTTLDLTIQAEATAALRQGIDAAQAQHLNVHQGAVVVMDPRTGAIRAMVGGYDFRTSQFNRAWQAHRQAGSAFKPFTYTVAVMRGIPPTHLLLDEPLEFQLPDGKVWKPQDFDHTWHGWVTARYALENSINAATIRLEQQIGPASIVDLAHRMGVQSQLLPTLALTLGASDVTPLEMVDAYGVFANGGVRADPMAITKVTDWRGKVLEEHTPQRTVVLSPDVAYVMTDMLKGNVLRGTGTAANIGVPQAGKTGTTDDYRDAWYIGYTPYLTTGIWVGNDDNSPMNGVTGGAVPARIWAALMKKITATMPHDDWTMPDGVVQETVCGTSGSLAAPGCPDPRPEVFIKGTEPDAYTAPAGTPGSSSGPPQASTTTSPTPPDSGSQPDVGSGSGQGTSDTQQGSGSSPQPAGPPAPTPVATPVLAGTIPVVVGTPTDGSRVDVPFLIQGTTRPGATVHIMIRSHTALLQTQVADADVQADETGAFSYLVNPWFRPAGATYVVTVTATVGSQSGSTTMRVQLR
ncbi:MAG TPA: PBP1A family penicillin-binding protein [bacterium]|nr:PBP1A family penicillin-binding protein [bacterium]